MDAKSRPKRRVVLIQPDERERLSLSISTETQGEAVVVHLSGDLDVYTAPRLKEALEVSGAGAARVIADMSGVPFIDSTALGVLVGALQVAQSNGGDLRLVVGDAFLLKIFRITGFDGMFSIYPKVEEALSAD